MFMYFMKFQGISRSLREFATFKEFSWVSLTCGNPAHSTCTFKHIQKDANLGRTISITIKSCSFCSHLILQYEAEGLHCRIMVLVGGLGSRLLG